MAYKLFRKACALTLLAYSTAIYADANTSLYSTIFSILSYAKWNKPSSTLCTVNNATLAQHLMRSNPAPDSFKILSIQAAELKHTHCQALIFSNLSPKEEQQLLNGSVNFPALSISINNAECEIGSAFCLYQRKVHYSFKINMDSLTQAKVHIDPRILMLAKTAEEYE